MARYAFKLPDIGEGIAEAEIVAWHVAVGDVVEEDAPLADLMTDKATVEMTSPVAGRVLEIAGGVGDQVAIGSVLAVFDAEDGEGESSVADAPRTQSFVSSEVETPAPAAQSAPTSFGTNGTKILASPAVRARAKDLGVDLAKVKPAQGDRVRHSDLDAYLRYSSSIPRPQAQPGGIEEIKIVGLRRRIAEKVAESKRRIPHFTYVEELDVTQVEALRAAMNADRGERPRLTLLPFLIKAITHALPDFPMVNAHFDDVAGVVSRHASVHLGIATQTDNGLTVPVIRDAQALDVWELAAEVVRLAEAARLGKASREELSGSTLTLTSLGPLGGIASTPIINRPEVAIIGVNRIVDRPAVVEGRIEVRKLMNLSSSFDHRVVDGWDAASFIQAIKRLIETPALLFVDNGA